MFHAKLKAAQAAREKFDNEHIAQAAAEAASPPGEVPDSVFEDEEEEEVAMIKANDDDRQYVELSLIHI